MFIGNLLYWGTTMRMDIIRIQTTNILVYNWPTYNACWDTNFPIGEVRLEISCCSLVIYHIEVTNNNIIIAERLLPFDTHFPLVLNSFQDNRLVSNVKCHVNDIICQYFKVWFLRFSLGFIKQILSLNVTTFNNWGG